MEKNKENFIKIDFLSLADNVALARVLIASLVARIDITLNDLEEIKVAVSEAVSNAIIHGYQGSAEQLVTVKATIKNNTLTVTIEDQGIGIEDIKQAMSPAFSTDPERMGLGFVFMQSFMDKVKVISTPGKGTKVVLEKNLTDENSISVNLAN